MKAGRLISIVLLLQNYGKLTTQQLAERLEVTSRTIMRDMETLSGAGIPVYAERGQQGGWLLTEGYRTSLTGMRTEELAALLVSAHAELLSDLGQLRHFEAGLQKLLAASPEETRKDAAAVRAKLHIDGAGWHAGAGSREAYPLLPVVQEAVWHERALRILYRSEQHQTERVIYPLGLVAKRSVWYAVAYGEDGGLRTFRVSRILEAEKLEESFRVPGDFDLAQYWEQSLEWFKQRLPRYPAKVRLKERIAARLSKERFVTVSLKSSEKSAADLEEGANNGPATSREERSGARAAADSIEKSGTGTTANSEVEADARATVEYEAGGGSEEAGDGWLTADVIFETEESACEIALSFGASIEVLEPEELRNRIADEIGKAGMLYLDRKRSRKSGDSV